MREYAKLMRIDQWIKNAFIFLPLFFSGEWFNYAHYENLLIGFFSFSLAASSLYIINDIQDADYDRLHPEKSKRPIASGTIKSPKAMILALTLFACSILLAYLSGIAFLYIIIGYTVLNLIYSFGLKHIPILDISIISVGFVLRIYAGGILTDVALSKWIVLMTFLLAMFLAIAKRRDDVLLFDETGKTMRRSIDGYTIPFINAVIAMMSSVISVTYILYTTSAEVIGRIGNDNVYLTSIFVIIGLLRYLQITIVEEKSGSPVKLLFRDIFIQACIACWVASFYFLIYWKY